MILGFLPLNKTITKEYKKLLSLISKKSGLMTLEKVSKFIRVHWKPEAGKKITESQEKVMLARSVK